MAPPLSTSRPPWRTPHYQIPLIYAVVAALWIISSDRLVTFLAGSKETMMLLSVVKGWCFVSVTAILLCHLIRRHFVVLERSRATVAASEERFASAFHLSPTATAICGFNSGAFLDVNEAWLVTFGYDRQEVIGRTVEELGMCGERERITPAVRDGGAVRNLELQFFRKGGEAMDVLLSADSITLSNEPYLLVVLSDITERRRSEAALKRQASELRERNAELARYNSAAVGRELRVIELKQQVNALSSRLGEGEPYPLSFLKDVPVESPNPG